MVMSMITVVFALFAFLLVVLLILCCKYTILPRCPVCFMTILRKIERKLFWNSLLRALLETYYSTAIVFFFTMGGIKATG